VDLRTTPESWSIQPISQPLGIVQQPRSNDSTALEPLQHGLSSPVQSQKPGEASLVGRTVGSPVGTPESRPGLGKSPGTGASPPSSSSRVATNDFAERARDDEGDEKTSWRQTFLRCTARMIDLAVLRNRQDAEATVSQEVCRFQLETQRLSSVVVEQGKAIIELKRGVSGLNEQLLQCFAQESAHQRATEAGFTHNAVSADSLLSRLRPYDSHVDGWVSSAAGKDLSSTTVSKEAPCDGRQNVAEICSESDEAVPNSPAKAALRPTAPEFVPLGTGGFAVRATNRNAPPQNPKVKGIALKKRWVAREMEGFSLAQRVEPRSPTVFAVAVDGHSTGCALVGSPVSMASSLCSGLAGGSLGLASPHSLAESSATLSPAGVSTGLRSVGSPGMAQVSSMQGAYSAGRTMQRSPLGQSGSPIRGSPEESESDDEELNPVFRSFAPSFNELLHPPPTMPILASSKLGLLDMNDVEEDDDEYGAAAAANSCLRMLLADDE